LLEPLLLLAEHAYQNEDLTLEMLAHMCIMHICSCRSLGRAARTQGRKRAAAMEAVTVHRIPRAWWRDVLSVPPPLPALASMLEALLAAPQSGSSCADANAEHAQPLKCRVWSASEHADADMMLALALRLAPGASKSPVTTAPLGKPDRDDAEVMLMMLRAEMQVALGNCLARSYASAAFDRELAKGALEHRPSSCQAGVAAEYLADSAEVVLAVLQGSLHCGNLFDSVAMLTSAAPALLRCALSAHSEADSKPDLQQGLADPWADLVEPSRAQYATPVCRRYSGFGRRTKSVHNALERRKVQGHDARMAWSAAAAREAAADTLLGLLTHRRTRGAAAAALFPADGTPAAATDEQLYRFAAQQLGPRRCSGSARWEQSEVRCRLALELLRMRLSAWLDSSRFGVPAATAVALVARQLRFWPPGRSQAAAELLRMAAHGAVLDAAVPRVIVRTIFLLLRPGAHAKPTRVLGGKSGKSTQPGARRLVRTCAAALTALLQGAGAHRAVVQMLAGGWLRTRAELRSCYVPCQELCARVDALLGRDAAPALERAWRRVA
jgi:hypothetical protein